MKKVLFILFLLFQSIFLFSQNLEETIYEAAEAFIANQNKKGLQVLNDQESSFKNTIKTKDEQLALVFLQSHKAYYLDQHTQLQQAISTYEGAVNRFNENKLSTLSDFDIIENCLKPLGNLYTKTGDYTNALSIINQYIFLAKKANNKTHQMSGAINLAKLYYTLGNHEMVIKITSEFTNSKNIDHAQKEKLKAINLDSQIALNLIPEQIKGASNYKIELQKGNFQSAFKIFIKEKTRIEATNASTRELAKLYFEEAQIHYLLKDPEVALKCLRVSLKKLLPEHKFDDLPNKDLLYAENTFIDIFDLYAELEINPDIALQCFDLSFHVSELLQNNWTSQETKILNETNNRIRSEKCIKILFDTYNQTKDKSFLFNALLYSENNKASVLKDMMQKKMRLKRFPDDSLLTKEFKLLKRQEQITSLLVKEQLGSNKASKMNALSIQLSNISLQLKSLKQTISKIYSDDESTFSLKTLQTKLIKDNLVLTEYFYGKKHMYQFIVSEKDIIINQIPINPEIQKKITDFINLFNESSIINNDISNYTEQAFNIYKLLKFDALSSYKNVLIIPDGVLNFMPFESLLSEKTDITSFSKMPFVVSSQNILYNSNINFYLNPVKSNKNNTILGFFPVFENTNQALTHSIDEASAIEDEMSVKLFMRNDATKINFIKNANKYNVLHLSTHASGGNFIEPANLSFYDDKLLLNELYSLDLNTNLVILSACETGIGKLYKGEGAMSIARGFQYAGAGNLLFSLWQINDLSTAQIMQSFYRDYNKNHSAFMANHNSKIQYFQNESISNFKKSPYYWSAFVFYGAPEPAKSQNFTLYIIFGIVIVLIILFLLFKTKTNGKRTSRVSS